MNYIRKERVTPKPDVTLAFIARLLSLPAEMAMGRRLARIRGFVNNPLQGGFHT